MLLDALLPHNTWKDVVIPLLLGMTAGAMILALPWLIHLYEGGNCSFWEFGAKMLYQAEPICRAR